MESMSPLLPRKLYKHDSVNTLHTGQTCVAGIDYSTSSPCICVNVKNDYDFHYLTRTKKFARAIDFEGGIMVGEFLAKTSPPHQLDFLDEFDTKIEQYTFIANWAIDVLSRYNVQAIWLEGYAFAATGRVFHIGENTGILKYRLMKKKLPYSVVAPTMVKSNTLGKGNASKEEAIERFNQDFDTDINELLDTPTMNPASDIADSYLICRYGMHQWILAHGNI